MNGLLASAAAITGYLVDAVKYGPLLIQFIYSSISAAEATNLSGPDKLTKVLNAIQVAADGLLPNEAAQIDAFMADLGHLVNDIVALYNDIGFFVKKTKPTNA